MTAAETEIRDQTDPVEAWRAEQLELAGYGAAGAAELAARADVDLHVAIELVADGCAPELALKILL
jgi:glutamine synthetase adenylyltransferase